MFKKKIKVVTKKDLDAENDINLPKIKIIAHALDYEMEDNPETGCAKMTIWGMGKDNDRYLLRQEECPIFCYIALPKYVNGNKFDWNTITANYVFDHLTKSLSYREDHAPTKFEFCLAKEIYNYQGDKKAPMIKIYFKNQNSLKHCFNLLKKPIEVRKIGKLELKLWESNISMVRKILTLRKTKYAQWFEVEGREIPVGHPERTAVPGKDNRIKELLIDWETINPIPLSKSKNWVSRPDVLAFDIETYSDNHKRMPNELCADNVAYMIQAVFQTQGLKHTRKRFVIIMGDCKEIKVGEATEVIIKGVTHKLDPTVKIIRVDSEPALVKAYADIIMEMDPDVITGYNIMGYDYNFLDTRLGIFYRETWPCMGRLMGKIPIMEKRSWSSSAYGTNTICNLKMNGRINIDLLPLIKRGYKFERYTLDYVCKYFLKRGKHDVKAQQMFETYEFMQAAKKLKDDFGELWDNKKKNKVQYYNMMDTGEIIEKINKNEEKDKNEDEDKNKIKEENKLEEYVKSIQNETKEKEEIIIDPVVLEKINSQLEKEIYIDIDGDKLYKKRIEEIWEIALEHMTKVVAYGVEDAELVIDLFEKLSVWIELVELSSIVGVTITDLFTRGQQIRCQSQIYDLAAETGFVLNKRFAPKQFFNGGFVGDPKPGLYENIICLDFSSLYPSIIIDGNMCYTTYVSPEYDDEIPDDMCNIVEFEQEEDASFKTNLSMDDENSFQVENEDFNGDDFIPINTEEYAQPVEEGKKKKEEVKTVMRKYRMRFIKKEILEGIVPRLLSNLLTERNNVKGQIKVIEKDLDKLEELVEPLKDIINWMKEEASQKEEATKKEKISSSDENKTSSQEPILIIRKDANNPAKDEKYTKEQILEKFKQAAQKLIQDSEDTNFKFDNNVEKYLNKLRELISEIETLLVMLDKRQAGLKVAANSMFGFFGAQDGLLPFIEIAMAVTGKGRFLIGTVNDYVKDKYNADVVYNDTDSSMIDMHLKTKKESVEWGIRLAEEISGKKAKKDKDGNIIEPAVPGLFGEILQIAWEKSALFLLFKKKKYAYLPIGKNFEYQRNPDTGELIIVKKGITPARRDNSYLIRSLYMDILSDILMFRDIDTAYGRIVDVVVNLLENKINPRKYLTVSRALGAEYKAENFFMKVFSDELARVGKPMAAGERALYIVVKTEQELENERKGVKGEDSKVRLGLKMRDIDMWEDSWIYYKGPSVMAELKTDNDRIESLPESFAKILNVKIEKDDKPIYPAENIDHLYYVEHLLMNPIDQLFSVGYMKDLAKYGDFTFTPQNSRAHPCSIDTPVKMIGKIMTDHIKGGHTVPSKGLISKIRSLKEEFINARKAIDQRENKKVVLKINKTSPVAQSPISKNVKNKHVDSEVKIIRNNDGQLIKQLL